MKPIEDMLRLWIQVALQRAYIVGPIGEKGYLLIHLHTLGFQDFKQAPLGLIVIAAHEGETLRVNGQNYLTHFGQYS